MLAYFTSPVITHNLVSFTFGWVQKCFATKATSNDTFVIFMRVSLTSLEQLTSNPSLKIFPNILPSRRQAPKIHLN